MDREDALKNDEIYRKRQGLSSRSGPRSNRPAPRCWQEIQKYADLMKWRLTWPNLVHDLHNSLPVPQADVVQGMKNWDAALIKKIPRNERKIS